MSGFQKLQKNPQGFLKDKGKNKQSEQAKQASNPQKYHINFAIIIHEALNSMTNTLNAFIEKVGNMQEQIQNVKKRDENQN